jgi:hypothetical protein
MLFRYEIAVLVLSTQQLSKLNVNKCVEINKNINGLTNFTVSLNRGGGHAVA